MYVEMYVKIEGYPLCMYTMFVYRAICGVYLSTCSCIGLYLVYNIKMFVYNVFVSMEKKKYLI